MRSLIQTHLEKMAKFNSDEFITVEIKSVKGDAPIPFDLYILMPLNKNIVHVKAQNEILDQAFLNRCIQHGRTVLYIHKSQELILQTYLNPPAEKAPELLTPNEIAPTAEKIDLPVQPLQPASDPTANPTANPSSSFEAAISPPNPDQPPEEMMSGLLSDEPKARQEAMASAKAMIEKVLESSPESPEKKAVLEILDNALNEHSSSVAVYAALFSIPLKYKDQTVLIDLIKAALLHDLGLSQVSPAAYRSPEKMRPADEAKLLINHVSEGVEVAKELGITLSPRVLTMLQSHHEKFDGTGYPSGVEGFKMDEFGQILCLADFVSNTCQGRWDGKVKTLDEAFGVISSIEKETTFPHYLNPMLFKKIMGWIKQGAGKDYLDKATSIVEENKEKLLKAS